MLVEGKCSLLGTASRLGNSSASGRHGLEEYRTSAVPIGVSVFFRIGRVVD